MRESRSLGSVRAKAEWLSYSTLLRRQTVQPLDARPAWSPSRARRFHRVRRKESNRLDEVKDELVHDWEEVREVYLDPKSDPLRTCVLPVLTLMPRSQLALMTRITERHIRRLRNGHQQPSPNTRAMLTRAATDYARARLGPDAPADDLAASAAFLRSQGQTRTSAQAQDTPATASRRSRS